MRKFKHKITRDVVKTYSDDYYISTETTCIPKRFIENSNDWEEIVEKDYEILKSCPIEGNIYSIKRLSDERIFSVGEVIGNMGCTEVNKISHVEVDENNRVRLCYDEDCFSWLSSAIKVKQAILTTEDGVEIYGGEKLHLVTKCFTLGVGLNFTKDELKDKDYLFFAKKENAERYINLNSPKYTVLDMLKVANHYAYIKNVTEDRILKYLAKNGI